MTHPWQKQPLKVITVTIFSKNQPCQVTHEDFQANFFKIFMNVNHFTKKIVFWRWKEWVLLVFGSAQIQLFPCFPPWVGFLHSHLKKQLRWRQIQINQSEVGGACSWLYFCYTHQSWLMRKNTTTFLASFNLPIEEVKWPKSLDFPWVIVW